MSGMDPVVRHVVEQASSFVEPGGRIVLLGSTANSVRVRYERAKDKECAECVLAPADLRQFLEEMFARQVPRIVRVELEDVPA